MACATSDQRTSNNVPLPALCEIVVCPKLVCSSIPAVLSSIEICVGKIKTVSNLCNNSDRSTAFTESFLQVYIYMWILITASACSFWRKFWSSGIATNYVTLDFSFVTTLRNLWCTLCGCQVLHAATRWDVKDKQRLVSDVVDRLSKQKEWLSKQAVWFSM